MSQALSVSQALTLAKTTLEQISATIIGEVSELSDKPGYKAVYFTLSDKSAALSCLMWRNIYQRYDIELKQGMLVEVSGVFSVYAAKGRMNFDVKSLRLAGEGDLRLKVALLAKKLEAEGLMSPVRKRALPEYPSKIAVVTSPRGKAIHDVLRTLRRRFPLAEVLIAGVPVEGEGAAAHIREGLSAAQASGAEIILLVRGGGSYEDLMPFNDEGLARAIAASSIPIVTGIGHEPDNSIADMVADFRASTPTAAAEHVVPDIRELLTALARMESYLARGLQAKTETMEAALKRLRERPIFTEDSSLLKAYELQLEATAQRLQQALPQQLIGNRQLLEALIARLALIGSNLLRPFGTQVDLGAAQLENLSPLKVLARGYSITYDEKGHVIDSVEGIEPYSHLKVRLVDGTLDCTIDSKHSEKLPGLKRED
jgi:exodeoxyribonuclease VII large subunit